jgi:hypothetical protein
VSLCTSLHQLQTIFTPNICTHVLNFIFSSCRKQCVTIRAINLFSVINSSCLPFIFVLKYSEVAQP